MPPKAKTTYSENTREAAAAILEMRARQQRNAAVAGVWKPISKPQKLALESLAHELFYGGAAGGGKTDLLIGAALTKHYKSIIFRREFPQLREIVLRSKEILRRIAPKARYNAQHHVWERNMPDGRILEYGAMQHLDDREKYQGRPHDMKAFDEITQFMREQYTYNLAWNRTVRVGQHYRALCTGNPPMTPEGEWVITYWGPWLLDNHDKPARAGELRWYATIEGVQKEMDTSDPIWIRGIPIKPRSRTFIPALITDNPLLLESGYAGVLQALPEPMRSMLLFGDFSIKAASSPWQIIPTEWVRKAQERWKRITNNEEWIGPITALGLDVSRGGSDRTVVQLKHDSFFAEQIIKPGTEIDDGVKAARLAIEALGMDPAAFSLTEYETTLRRVPMNIDVIGFGSSAYDTLKYFGLDVYDVWFSAPSKEFDSSGKLPLLNLRAEGYWKLREALHPDYGMNLAIPPDHELMSELTSPMWFPTPRGIQVESKEDVEKRLGRSPDKADALVLAFLDMRAKAQDKASIPGSTSMRSYGPNTTPIEPSINNRYATAANNPKIPSAASHLSNTNTHADTLQMYYDQLMGGSAVPEQYGTYDEYLSARIRKR